MCIYLLHSEIKSSGLTEKKALGTLLNCNCTKYCTTWLTSEKVANGEVRRPYVRCAEWQKCDKKKSIDIGSTILENLDVY